MTTAVLILCGGKSSRMGQDKGLLLRNEKTWVERQVIEFEQLGDVFISVGSHNEANYSKFGYPLICDYPNMESYNGVFKALSVAKQHLMSYDNLIFIPVDMQLLSCFTVKELVKSSSDVCFENRKGMYSLPFKITSSTLASIDITHFKNQSVKYFLDEMQFKKIKIESDEFQNLNSPDDIDKWLA